MLIGMLASYPFSVSKINNPQGRPNNIFDKSNNLCVVISPLSLSNFLNSKDTIILELYSSGTL